MTHPNVVQLYGYNLNPPHMCLVEELMMCSLEDVLLVNKGTLRLEQVRGGVAAC